DPNGPAVRGVVLLRRRDNPPTRALARDFELVFPCPVVAHLVLAGAREVGAGFGIEDFRENASELAGCAEPLDLVHWFGGAFVSNFDVAVLFGAIFVDQARGDYVQCAPIAL